MMDIGFEAHPFIDRSCLMTLFVEHIFQLESIRLVSPLNLLSPSFFIASNLLVLPGSFTMPASEQHTRRTILVSPWSC